MAVTGEILPSEKTILTALEKEARDTVNRAKADVAPVVATQTPRHKGRLAAALAPRVTRTATGVALIVAPPRGRLHSGTATVAQVLRFVTKGTGLFREGGGAKAVIRGKRGPSLDRGAMSIYGRWVYSVAGQRPNAFMDRIKTVGGLRVDFEYRAGAARAAKTLERVLD